MKNLVFGILLSLWGAGIVAQAVITGNYGSFSSSYQSGILAANALGVGILAAGIGLIKKWLRERNESENRPYNQH